MTHLTKDNIAICHNAIAYWKMEVNPNTVGCRWRHGNANVIVKSTNQVHLMKSSVKWGVTFTAVAETPLGRLYGLTVFFKMASTSCECRSPQARLHRHSVQRTSS
eukprot:7377279-Prymnesium_polylepis.2